APIPPKPAGAAQRPSRFEREERAACRGDTVRGTGAVDVVVPGDREQIRAGQFDAVAAAQRPRAIGLPLLIGNPLRTNEFRRFESFGVALCRRRGPFIEGLLAPLG